MKDLQKIFKSICIILAAICMTGCLAELSEDKVPSGTQLQVVGRVTPFGEIGTKGTKTADESKVTNMVMMVVDSDDNKIETQYIESDRPLFVIDRSSSSYTGHDKEKLKNCHIYIIANVPAAYITLDGSGNLTSFHNLSNQEIESVNDFLNVDYSLDKIAQPEIGFPMWGVTSEDNLDLRTSAEGGISDGVLEIPLECLYSKIVFNISVIPDQIVSGVVQQFLMTSWEVHNVPSKVRVRKPAANDPTEHAGGDSLSTVFSRVDNNTNPVMQSGGNEKMTFSFYMPEHKINPAKSISYPAGISDDDKQRFKPQLISDSQRPTYVRINGIYLDHNKREHEVSYDVYLGIDNYENFHIIRDCQYNNNITIKGITNSKDGAGISMDHRVNKSQNQFKFTLERETLLDSHWEIRPIRITLDHDRFPNAKIQVQILNATGSGAGVANWLRMEMPSSPGGDNYCSVTPENLAYGKRKYFTTELVSSTLSGNYLYEIQSDPNVADHTIWMYIDEYPDLPTSDGSILRTATVQCRFYEGGDTTQEPDVTENYVFSQRSLHKVTYGGRSYGIEYYEEYLHNYDSNEGYGTTTDGMAWGLNNSQMSDTYDAVYVEGNFLGFNTGGLITSWLKEKYNPKYDFYITYAEALNGKATYRQHSGYQFTKEIAETANIGALATNFSANSAVEYCYNKNKRSASGQVEDMQWYLPAIDDIEGICMGGYNTFNVFQDKYYWSSQPAFLIYDYKYQGISSDEGHFYVEDVTRARSTKVDNSFQNVKSDDTVAATRIEMQLTMPSFLNFEVEATPVSTGATQAQIEAGRGPGNMPRTAINRIRCAYKILQNKSSSLNFEDGVSVNGWTASYISQSSVSDYIHSGTKSGQTTNNRENIISFDNRIQYPKSLSFFVKSSNTSTSGTWHVQYSTNGTSGWTDIQTQASNVDSWTPVIVDLTSYENVYLRIRHYNSNTSNRNTRYIDDIVLEYEED